MSDLFEAANPDDRLASLQQKVLTATTDTERDALQLRVDMLSAAVQHVPPPRTDDASNSHSVTSPQSHGEYAAVQEIVQFAEKEGIYTSCAFATKMYHLTTDADAQRHLIERFHTPLFLQLLDEAKMLVNKKPGRPTFDTLEFDCLLYVQPGPTAVSAAPAILEREGRGWCPTAQRPYNTDAAPAAAATDTPSGGFRGWADMRRERSPEDDSRVVIFEIKDMNFGYAYALFQLEMRLCYYLYRRNQKLRAANLPSIDNIENLVSLIGVYVGHLPSLMPVEQRKRVCQDALGVLPLVAQTMCADKFRLLTPPPPLAAPAVAASAARAVPSVWVQQRDATTKTSVGRAFECTPAKDHVDALAKAIKAELAPKFPSLVAPDIAVFAPGALTYAEPAVATEPALGPRTLLDASIEYLFELPQ